MPRDDIRLCQSYQRNEESSEKCCERVSSWGWELSSCCSVGRKRIKIDPPEISLVTWWWQFFRTNAEKLPLARLCGMNTNNELLPFVRAFIPSAQKWVFHWLWTNGYPEFLDSDALKLTKRSLVDQNKNNWIALTSNLWLKNARYGTAF